MRYLLGVLLFCLLGNLEAQERPDWVKQRPVSSMHYIGIACVSKSEKDYMQKAKQQALNQSERGVDFFVGYVGGK